jgi:hypothetical protein
MNPSMGSVVGRPPEWFEGRTPLDLMPPEDAARGREILAKLAGRPGSQLPGEFRLKHAGGAWRVVEGVATNLLHDPAVRGIVLNSTSPTSATARRSGRRIEGIINARRHSDPESPRNCTTAWRPGNDRLAGRAIAPSATSARATWRQRGKRSPALARCSGGHERTRRLTFELRPRLLDAGLGAAIRDIADALARDTGANVTKSDAPHPASADDRDARFWTIRSR